MFMIYIPSYKLLFLSLLRVMIVERILLCTTFQLNITSGDSIRGGNLETVVIECDQGKVNS